VAEYARRSPAELLALLEEHLTPSGLTAGGAIGLTDGLIHHQDIRRPLGAAREVPAERLIPALRTALFAPTVRGILRAFDVRPVATDMEWSFGRGPEVHGTGEALLMAVAGRRGLAAGGDGFLALPVALSFDDELERGGLEPVDGGLGQQRVGHHGHHLGRVAVGGGDRGVVAVAFDDEFVEVAGLGRPERVQGEVVEDEQLDAVQLA